MNNNSKQPLKRRSWILLAIISTIVGGTVFAFFVLAFGHVKGFEFSPDSMKLRSFSYWQIPVVNLQIFPASRARVSTPLEKYLTTENFISNPANVVSRRWDITTARGGRWNYIGDAELVRSYFSLEDGDEKHPWVEWSKAHPQCAKTLWPIVVSAIKRRQYIAVPRLLELAEAADDDRQLAADIHDFLDDASVWLDQIPAESDQPNAANSVTGDAKS